MNGKTVWLGRFVFGASAVLFGVIALMWHDADTWQSLSNFWKMPFGRTVGDALMVLQIIGGLALLVPLTVRAASIVLGIVYALFCLACLPGIIVHPAVFGVYDGFFEQLSLLCGAFAVYAVVADAARAKAIGRASRIGLGLSTVVFTLAQIIYLQFTASLVPPWIPPNQMFWAVVTTIAFALAAIAMLINVRARLAAGLMALMIVLFGLLVWVPTLYAHPGPHGNWSEFAINFQIAGAAWMVAALRFRA